MAPLNSKNVEKNDNIVSKKKVPVKTDKNSDDDEPTSTASTNRRQKHLKNNRDSTHRTSKGFIELSSSSSSVLWVFVLPTAAVLTTDVWFPDIVVGGIDLQLAVLNITGSFFDGFFTPWETGAAKPSGPFTGMCQQIADDMRAFFFSTYTSWAGMVGFAAVMAHRQETSSIPLGLLYIVTCVIIGFFAHGLGSQVALMLSRRAASPDAKIQYSEKEGKFATNALFGSLVAYCCGTYFLVWADIRDYTNAFLSKDSEIALASVIDILDVDDDRIEMAAGIACSIAGAYTGNLVGNIVDSYYTRAGIPRGTVACNTFFAYAALLLPVLALHDPTWRRSAILKAFASSFCGACSAFAGHSSDSQAVYQKRTAKRAFQNSLANVVGAMFVFFLALALERLLKNRDTVDANGDGIVDLREIAMYYGIISGAEEEKVELVNNPFI